MKKLKSPTAAQIKGIRDALRLTQTECAQLLHTSLRNFAAWERGEREMHPIIFDWFNSYARGIK